MYIQMNLNLTLLRQGFVSIVQSSHKMYFNQNNSLFAKAGGFIQLVFTNQAFKIVNNDYERDVDCFFIHDSQLKKNISKQNFNFLFILFFIAIFLAFLAAMCEVERAE